MPFCLLNLTVYTVFKIIPCSDAVDRHTSILQVVRDVDTSVRRGLVGEQVPDRRGFVLADHLSCEGCEVVTDLARSQVRGRDIKVLSLSLPQLKGGLVRHCGDDTNGDLLPKRSPRTDQAQHGRPTGSTSTSEY